MHPTPVSTHTLTIYLTILFHSTLHSTSISSALPSSLSSLSVSDGKNSFICCIIVISLISDVTSSLGECCSVITSSTGIAKGSDRGGKVQGSLSFLWLLLDVVNGNFNALFSRRPDSFIKFNRTDVRQTALSSFGDTDMLKMYSFSYATLTYEMVFYSDKSNRNTILSKPYEIR